MKLRRMKLRVMLIKAKMYRAYAYTKVYLITLYYKHFRPEKYKELMLAQEELNKVIEESKKNLGVPKNCF